MISTWQLEHDGSRPMGVRMLRWPELTDDQRAELRDTFRHEMYPALTPLAMTLSPGHPLPHPHPRDASDREIPTKNDTNSIGDPSPEPCTLPRGGQPVRTLFQILLVAFGSRSRYPRAMGIRWPAFHTTN